MSHVLARSRTSVSGLGWERLCLLAILGIQVTLALLLPIAGPFSIDEIVYSEMTRSLTEGFGFFIDNGYQQVASPELATRFVSPTDSGMLAAQYPYGLPLLAAVPYAVAGVRGIMLINAVAFVAVLGVTFSIARRLLTVWIARVSIVVLTVSTYLWEYSIAIWPHMTTVALGLGSVLALLIATEDGRGNDKLYGVLSGLLFGMAVLNRLDAVLLAPLLLITIADRSRWRTTTLPFVAGLAPAATLLCISNWRRWDTVLPFSYGGTISDWLLPLVTLGVGLLAALTAVAYAFRRYRPSKQVMALVVGGFTLVVLAIPRTREFVIAWAAGLWTLVVDLRSYRATDEAALQRLSDGSLIYFGTVKKALLQSAPYLLSTVIPIVVFWRSPNRRTVLWLATPIVTYVAFFALRAWHGGLSFNLRYLLPILPFAAILTAWSLRIVLDSIRSPGRTIRLVALVTLALFAVGRVIGSSLEGTAWLLSVPPLLIALGAAGTATAFLLTRTESSARLAVIFIVAGLTWAAAVSYGYDTAATLRIRGSHVETSSGIAAVMDDEALLIADWPDDTYGVKDHLEEVVIALPSNDEYATVEEVVDGFRDTRGVFGALPAATWDEMASTLGGVWVEVGIVGDYSVRRLEPAG